MNAQEPWKFEIATVTAPFTVIQRKWLFIFCASSENFDVLARIAQVHESTVATELRYINFRHGHTRDEARVKS